MATGTVSITEETAGVVKKITFDWLSTAGGAASDTTTHYYTGLVERVVYIPDSGGTAPDDQYDVTVTDDDSQDVLDGDGANLSQTTATQLLPSMGIGVSIGAIANSQLTLNVTNAGSANGGQVIIYIR